jgi:hypothetical protein
MSAKCIKVDSSDLNNEVVQFLKRAILLCLLFRIHANLFTALRTERITVSNKPDS